ncbi:unnamed protein product [Coffea canephora]|uniref:Uncharacterized protein n=1 Tax=Coffea canephora TaxID=49390 RepID=A0A068TRC8_COFCA|nr:unnamed protein product [Coffea canephora]
MTQNHIISRAFFVMEKDTDLLLFCLFSRLILKILLNNSNHIEFAFISVEFSAHKIPNALAEVEGRRIVKLTY